jgi:CubicO group peptidase (beta-lactamase class C family)
MQASHTFRHTIFFVSFIAEPMLKSILIFCLALICTLTRAQKQAITINKLSSSINQVMANEHIPGLMVGIATKDSIFFTGGFGYADIQTKQPVTADNLFRLGSVTKMFVSLAILQLMNEHKISLNDRLKGVAPEILFTNKWEATNPVRIVNLLEHTSGFDDLKLNAFYNVTSHDLKGLETVLACKKSLVCRWTPGERCSYCNPNYVILAYLVEKISGMPYDQYIAKNILQPLNMTATNFNLRITDKSREVKEYIYKNGQYEQIPVIPDMAGGDGGLKSSANDMIKFVRFFLNNGKPLFKASLIDEMETPHSSLAVNAGLKTGYALANETFAGYNKYLFRGHKGIAGSCYTTLMYSRALGSGFIIASNGNNDMEPVSKLIISFLEQNKPARTPIGLPLNKTAIASYLGFYQFESPRMELSAFSDRLKVGFHTFIKNDTLYLKELSGNVDTLIETGPLQFAKKGMNATQYVFFNNGGKNVLYHPYFLGCNR